MSLLPWKDYPVEQRTGNPPRWFESCDSGADGGTPPKGENFDFIKIRITNCACNFHWQRQHEAKSRQLELRLPGYFLHEPLSNIKKTNLSRFPLSR